MSVSEAGDSDDGDASMLERQTHLLMQVGPTLHNDKHAGAQKPPENTVTFRVVFWIFLETGKSD